MNLIVYVEGISEEEFVKRQLAQHLRLHGWNSVQAIGVANSLGPKATTGGLTNWRAVKADLNGLFKTHADAVTRFTTLWDYYRIPNTFPGVTVAKAAAQGVDRGTIIESALAEVFQEPRFVPYIQIYEFEALVLAALDGVKWLYPEHLPSLNALQQFCRNTGNCEGINDGPDTHPARRIDDAVPGFLRRKEEDGPSALRAVDLEVIRASCPRFSHWLGRLEALPGSP